MQKTEVLGIAFDRVTLKEAVEKIAVFVSDQKPHLIVTANPETVMCAKVDQVFSEVLGKASLVVADGIGVVWAGKVLKSPLPERIPGIELTEQVLSRAAKEGWKVYLLGSEKGVAAKAAENLLGNLPELNIVGTWHGYFKSGAEEKAVIRRIKAAKPDILLVALGVPRQEKWLAAHLGFMKVPVAIGVGGSFNIWAGTQKRAPVWIRKIHLEWFYRLVKEPKRIKRVSVLPIFVLSVLFSRISARR
ncbi:MAG TPA: WecB/TagA/CpsF family glycosyltransferase [Natronincola sp.]|nr:WecB/TagA/CpsF family glycosyltransferase [Natronincola sp.]